jgi:hypothetical protein
MITNKIYEIISNVPVHSTSDFFAYMVDLGSSDKALCGIILLIGIGLYFSRKPLKKMVDKQKRKLIHYAEGNLFPYTPNLKLYYQRGFFTLYWTIVWLVCRFTIIKPIFFILNETIDSIIFARFLAVILSMGIALIPSLVLTSISDLNETVSAIHFNLCVTYRMYLKIILKLFVIRTYATNTKIKEFLSFLFLFSLFLVYLFTGSLMVLTLWLTIIYFGIYSDHIIKEVFLSNGILIEEEISSLSQTIKPERFLFNFRFFYWLNKLPDFFNQEAYTQGYSFEAMDREEFFQHVTIFNEWLEFGKKIEKQFENPEYKRAIISAALKSEGAKDVKTKDILIKAIEELNKEISSEEQKKKTDIKTFTSSQNKRCYHSTPKSYMMDGEDGGRSENNTSSAGRFVFPTYERPLDLQEVNDALNVANIEVKNGALVHIGRNEEITDVVIQYPHPNDNDLLPGSETDRKAVLIINAKDGNPKGILKLVTQNESFGKNLPATGAAGASAAEEAATKSGGSVKQALSKLSFNKGSKRVAVGAAVITAGLTMVNLGEDVWEKTHKPNSFYNEVVKPTLDDVKETFSKPKPSDTK